MKKLTIDQPFSEFNFYPKYIIPYKDQDKLHFLAIPQNYDFNGDMISFDLYDIQINL